MNKQLSIILPVHNERESLEIMIKVVQCWQRSVAVWQHLAISTKVVALQNFITILCGDNQDIWRDILDQLKERKKE